MPSNDEYTEKDDSKEFDRYLIIRVADQKLEAEIKSLVEQIGTANFPVMPSDELVTGLLGKRREKEWLEGAEDARLTVAGNGTFMRIQLDKTRERLGLKGGNFDELDKRDVWEVLTSVAAGRVGNMDATDGLESSNHIGKCGLNMAAETIEEWVRNLTHVCEMNSKDHRGPALAGYRDNMTAYQQILLDIADEIRQED